ncbi:unnamed protein product, partial [Laminaria digitata]
GGGKRLFAGSPEGGYAAAGDDDDDDGEDEDDGSDASGALIPAQDLGGFEDEDDPLLAGTPPDGEDQLNVVAGTAAAAAGPVAGDDGGGGGSGNGEGGSSSATGAVAAAAAAAAADDSGTDTDATEVDTDDGPTGEARPTSPGAGSGNNASAARGANVGTPAAVAFLASRSQVRGSGHRLAYGKEEGGSGSGQEPVAVALGEARSPGGSVLLRTSTEDAMQAIARDQQRADAARVAAQAARDGAGRALACEPEEEEIEE